MLIKFKHYTDGNVNLIDRSINFIFTVRQSRVEDSQKDSRVRGLKNKDY